jgi:hypothetical protein
MTRQATPNEMEDHNRDLCKNDVFDMSVETRFSALTASRASPPHAAMA